MAQSLDDNRDLSITSIRGRRLGLDGSEFLVGVKDVRKVVTNATSDTTGTLLPNHGLVSVVTTTNDTWTLTDPAAGVSVTLVTASTSTGVHTISNQAATINSSNGDEGDGVLLKGAGAYVQLMGLTTAVWALTARASTALAEVSS